MVQLPPRSPEPSGPDGHDPSGEPEGKNRRKYRPPAGVPIPRNRGIGGKTAAVIIHALLIALAIIPFASPELVEQMLGAGGPGPAGGGGGGRKGNGGAPIQERTQFVQVKPPPPPVVPQIKPPEIKPIVPPVPEPPKPVPQDSKAEKTDKPVTETATTIGVGGGTGNDGTAGNGPGTGGGKGSGVGTGTGSAVGPGTGGGAGTVYEPSPIELVLPPMPTPKKLQGKTILAQFDVDSTGKVIDFTFEPTSDGGYNRKLRETFAAVRFRPGVNGLGTPVRAKTQLQLTI